LAESHDRGCHSDRADRDSADILVFDPADPYVTSSRKKPGVAFWATVVVVVVLVLLAYPLSFGPACWIVARPGTSEQDFGPVLRTIYWPLGRIIYRRTPIASPALVWYVKLGLTEGCFVHVPGNSDGQLPMTIWDHSFDFLDK
jgi:hypothetical protein